MRYLVLLLAVLLAVAPSCAKRDPSQDYTIQRAVESDDDPDIPLP